MGGYWVCDACHSLNEPRYGRCYKCHVKRGEAKPQPIIPGAKAGPAASEVFGRPVGDERGEPSLLAALLIGATAATLLTAFWYWFEAGIHLAQGRAAWLVGVLIAVVVLVAGTLGGRRRVSFMLPVISFVLTLAAVVIGEYLIISTAIARAAGKASDGLFLATPQEVVRVAAEYLGADPLRPILWLVALAAAWLIPWGVLVGSNDDEGR